MLTRRDIAINEREKGGEGAVACRLRIPEDVSRGEQIMLPGDARYSCWLCESVSSVCAMG